MEPLYQIAISALGALILFGLSLANSRLKKIGEIQETQGNQITELRALVVGVNGTPGLIAKMNDMHAWRNAQQAADLADANAEIARMKDEDRRHGPPDRRD